MKEDLSSRGSGQHLCADAGPCPHSPLDVSLEEVWRYLLGSGSQGSVGFEHFGRRCVLVAKYADQEECGSTQNKDEKHD